MGNSEELCHDRFASLVSCILAPQSWQDLLPAVLEPGRMNSSCSGLWRWASL